jgi:peroxiredoxin
MKRRDTRKMRAAVGVLALFTLLLLAATTPFAERPGQSGSSPAPSAKNPVGPLPDFTLPDQNGKAVSLRQFIGKKPVLLAFWATWCPHCVESVPRINRMNADLSPGGKLQILALNYMESEQKVTTFIAAKKISYTVLMDRGGVVARKFHVVGIPTYILIDRSGNVVFRGYEIPHVGNYLL